MPSISVDKDFLERNLSDLEDAWGLLDGLRGLLSKRPPLPGYEIAELKKQHGAEYAELYKNAIIGKWYIQNQELIEPILNASRKTCCRVCENLDEIIEPEVMTRNEPESIRKRQEGQKALASTEPAATKGKSA